MSRKAHRRSSHLAVELEVNGRRMCWTAYAARRMLILMDTPTTLPGGVFAKDVANRQNALTLAHKKALEASRSKSVSASALVRWARAEKASVRRG